jgi:UDPglucose 6-dehydrogenase
MTPIQPPTDVRAGARSGGGPLPGPHLHFSTAAEEAIALADLVFISVHTPTKTKWLGAGQASYLEWVKASARTLSKSAQGHTIVVEKSTLPARTAEVIQQILASAEGGKNFSVLSNPEFLAEGTAIYGLENPDRVLISGEDPTGIQALAGIYAVWMLDERIPRTNLRSSEFTVNALFAQRIS